MNIQPIKRKQIKSWPKINSVSKVDFQNYRTTVLESNGFIQALQYFIINICSFSGATLSSRFSDEASSKRFTKTSIDRIRKLNLNNIDFYNVDFVDFINNNSHLIDTNKAITFLDHHYYLENKSKLYGKNGDMHESFDHKLLFDIISTKKIGLLHIIIVNILKIYIKIILF